MTKLQKLIKECPCRVSDKAEGLAYFFDLPAGFYDPSANYIFIAPDFPEPQRFSMLAHERQHAICTKTRCFCTKSEYWQEYHAFRSELLTCFNYPDGLRWTVKHFQTSRGQDFPVHTKALNRLMKTKLWKTALLKLKEKP